MTEEIKVELNDKTAEEYDDMNALLDHLMITVILAAKEIRDEKSYIVKSFKLGKTSEEMMKSCEAFFGDEYDEETRHDGQLIFGGLIQMFSEIEPKLSKTMREAIEKVRATGKLCEE